MAFFDSGAPVFVEQFEALEQVSGGGADRILHLRGGLVIWYHEGQIEFRRRHGWQWLVLPCPLASSARQPLFLICVLSVRRRGGRLDLIEHELHGEGR